MDNVAIAEAYYKAIGNKDVASIEKYLHPDIQLVGPLSQMEGKETVFGAIKGYADMQKRLDIRSSFGKGDQAVVVYDVELPVGNLPAVAILTLQAGFIKKIELFFDARPFS